MSRHWNVDMISASPDNTLLGNDALANGVLQYDVGGNIERAESSQSAASLFWPR